MACDIATLKADALANGFYKVAQLPGLWRGIVVQLVCGISDGMACDIETLKTEACANGLGCLSEPDFRAVLLQALCNSQGSGSNSCLLCGVVDPVAAPTCSCALAYNSATATFFYWDATAAAWYAFLGPLL